MRHKEDTLDLEQKYRRLEKSLEAIDLPSSYELRVLLEQHDRESKGKAPFVPLTHPVRRSLLRPVWRYAASILLLIAMGWVGWLFLRQSPTPESGAAPVAGTPVGDSTSKDYKRQDSLLPVSPMLEWHQEGSQMAFELPQSEREHIHYDRHDNEIYKADAFSHSRDTSGDLMADNDELLPKTDYSPGDSNADPHVTSDYPDRKTMKDVDLKQNDNIDRRALRDESKKPAKKKRKLNVEKNDRDNTSNDVNVIVPERTARPHQVPIGNGRFVTVYH